MEYLKWDKLGLAIIALVFVLGLVIGRQWAAVEDGPRDPDRYAALDVNEGGSASASPAPPVSPTVRLTRQSGKAIAPRPSPPTSTPSRVTTASVKESASAAKPARVRRPERVQPKPAPIAKPAKPAASPRPVARPAPPAPVVTKVPASPKAEAIWKVTVRPEDAQRGPKGAPATMVVFGNYTCPTCRIFSKAVDRLVKEYGKNLRVVIKHRVLPANTSMTISASIAALAAGEQGKFWEYHNKLFFGGKPLSRDTFVAYAGELGLNTARFTKALDKKSLRTQVLSDAILANQVGAHSMPNILVNGVRTRGAKSYEVARELIERQLVLAKQKLAGGAKATALYDSLIAGGREFLPLGATVNTFDTSGSPALGPKDAKIQLVVFEDFQ